MTAYSALPACEIDALVAREVLEWKPWLEQRGKYTYVVWQKPGDREPWFKFRYPERERDRYIECDSIDWHKHIVTRVGDTFRPSTNGRAMLAVLDVLQSGLRHDWEISLIRTTNGVWSCTIIPEALTDQVTAESPSLPRAVCEAALAAVGGAS